MNRPLTVRPATLGDARLLYEWRHEATARAASFQMGDIPWETHLAWFNRRIADRGLLVGARLYILMEGTMPVGQIRYERRGAGEAEVAGFSIEQRARFRGFGTWLLRQTMPMARAALGVSRLTALIKTDNPVSEHVFRKAGFVVDKALRFKCNMPCREWVADGSVRPTAGWRVRVMRWLHTANDAVQRIALHLIHRNRTYYYGIYFGTNHPVVLFIKNLLRPTRFLTKVRYGQVWHRQYWAVNGTCWRSLWANACAHELRRDGILILPSLFRQTADHLTERVEQAMSVHGPADGYRDHGYLTTLDRALFDLMVDEGLLQILAHYMGGQPYLCAPIATSLAYPSEDRPSSRTTDFSQSKYSDGWHYDRVNQVQVHLLVTDATIADTHMQIARAQHSKHRVNLGRYDYYYSDEYVAEHMDIVSCVGPKGTAYIFDANSPHRLWGVKNSPRYMVKMEYSPGNGILPLIHPHLASLYHAKVEGGVPWSTLTALQREAIRHIVR